MSIETIRIFNGLTTNKSSIYKAFSVRTYLTPLLLSDGISLVYHSGRICVLWHNRLTA